MREEIEPESNETCGSEQRVAQSSHAYNDVAPDIEHPRVCCHDLGSKKRSYCDRPSVQISGRTGMDVIRVLTEDKARWGGEPGKC